MFIAQKQTRLNTAMQLLAEVAAVEDAYAAQKAVNKQFTLAERKIVESNDVAMHEKLKQVRKLLKSVMLDLQLYNDELADAAANKRSKK